MLSGKTRCVLATFLSTSLLMTACSSSDEKRSQFGENASAVLLDENGREYAVFYNDDGTETARYRDGDSVTFRREMDDSLTFLSGTESILPGIAIGYLLSKGIHVDGLRKDERTGAYRASSPRAATRDEMTGSKYAPGTRRENDSSYARGVTRGLRIARGFGSKGARSAVS